MAQTSPPWRPWGDHPIVVTIAVLAALAGIIVAIITFFPKENGPITYSGHVYRSSDGAPINAAEVTLIFGSDQQIDFTDAEGGFRFTLPSTSQSNNGMIRVEATGYKPYDLNITITPNTLQLKEIRLTPEVVSAPTSTPQDEASTIPTTTTPLVEPSAPPIVTGATTNPSQVEQELLAVNVLLTGPEASQEVRIQIQGYLNGPGYQALVRNIFDIMQDKKFKRPVHLDTINGKYIRLVDPQVAGSIPDAQYGNSEMLQAAILEHWNELPGYPDATSFDEIVELRP